jgi:hypothetical protein
LSISEMTIAIPAATPDRPIWLRVGTLIDGVSTSPLADAHVVYNQSQILFAGTESPPAHVLQPGQREPDLSLPDYSLFPGLIDAHTHLFLEGGELDLQRRAAYLKQSPERLLQLALPRLEKLVRLGIVGVRDAGDKDGVGLALSKLASSTDRPIMPYIDSPGAAIHHRGRNGSFMAEPIEDFASASQCVEARVRAGADRIKLIPTGIIDFKRGAVTTEPQMTTEEIRAIVAAAKSLGKQTWRTPRAMWALSGRLRAASTPSNMASSFGTINSVACGTATLPGYQPSRRYRDNSTMRIAWNGTAKLLRICGESSTGTPPA